MLNYQWLVPFSFQEWYKINRIWGSLNYYSRISNPQPQEIGTDGKINIISPARDIRTPLPHPFFHRKPSWLLGENSEWPLREQLPLTCLKSPVTFHTLMENKQTNKQTKKKNRQTLGKILRVLEEHWENTECHAKRCRQMPGYIIGLRTGFITCRQTVVKNKSKYSSKWLAMNWAISSRSWLALFQTPGRAVTALLRRKSSLPFAA